MNGLTGISGRSFGARNRAVVPSPPVRELPEMLLFREGRPRPARRPEIARQNRTNALSLAAAIRVRQ
ncbi:MAG: hypothetical protein AAF978_09355, partial [Cyanobacteria bacterium P01_E01_bin.48]